MPESYMLKSLNNVNKIIQKTILDIVSIGVTNGVIKRHKKYAEHYIRGS